MPFFDEDFPGKNIAGIGIKRAKITDSLKEASDSRKWAVFKHFHTTSNFATEKITILFENKIHGCKDPLF